MSLISLHKLYAEYGEKDSPSVLVPKTQPRPSNKLIPSAKMVSELAQEHGLAVAVRNCARYRGFIRVRFIPPKQFYRLIAEGARKHEGENKRCD